METTLPRHAAPSRRVRALEQLHRGDRIEVRIAVGRTYDDVVIRRGPVLETAPGIRVVWMIDEATGMRRVVNADECTVWRLS
ncbi:hypothetical protein [Pseudarthrobacter sp. PS3-L1]|uniref:hypothetical protein n=1 Tax=Pseudarthrobacter sp. PS3-L1 TaxID=3046207 RepID=UPI0024BB53FC|nr:hypothetical protein [Pseudarthrobacter sp. PS3-L1]MDJ0321035.1 hypothetical protein [Pseudarthrobacter sp. PS3-L1]